MAEENVVDDIWHAWHVAPGPWEVEFCDEFLPELKQLPPEVASELMAQAIVLKQFGPALARPHVDTLKGSKYPNMKELRFEVKRRPWRAVFAFDPKRKGIVLVAGCKAGIAQRLFYRRLIARAEDRFDKHLQRVGGGK